MAIFADVVDEWKKASGKEKLLIAGGGAAVVVLALYLHNKSTGSSAPGSSLAGTGTAGVGGSFQPPTGATQPATNSIPISVVNSAPPGQPLPPPIFKGPPLQKPPGAAAQGITPVQIAAASAPRQQPTITTNVYANTRHSPSAMPMNTQQSAPPQMRPR